MTEIQRSAQVPYTAAQMYELVNDVASYPEFLPWCDHVELLQQADREIVAEVTLTIGKLHQRFTTRNRLVPGESVEMELVEGPFQHLRGLWQFEPMTNGCRVSLDMRFEFKSELTRMTLSGPFNRIVNNLMEAFIDRAHAVYG